MTIVETLCGGCKRAEEQNAEWAAEGLTKRLVHVCYRTHGSGSCECPPCHPPGSFRMSGTAKYEVEIEYDIAELIRVELDRYRSLDMRGYEDWERPMMLLWSQLEDESPTFWRRSKEGVDVLVDKHSDFEMDDDRWTPEKFAELCAVCPEAVV